MKRPENTKEGKMIRKNSSITGLFILLSVVMFILGTATFVLASPPKPAPEDPIGPMGATLEGPAVVGNLVATLVTVTPAFGNPYLAVDFVIEGKCKGKSQKVENPVKIASRVSGSYLDIGTVDDFLYAGEAHLESVILQSVGPAGCHSLYGGEDMIIVNAKKPVHTVINGNHVIIADVVVLSIVYSAP